MKPSMKTITILLGISLVLASGCSESESNSISDDLKDGMWSAELYQPKGQKAGLMRFRGKTGVLGGGKFGFGLATSGMGMSDSATADVKDVIHFDLAIDDRDMSTDFRAMLKANQAQLNLGKTLPSTRDLNCWVINVTKSLSNEGEWKSKGVKTFPGLAGGLSSFQTISSPKVSNIPFGETRILASGVKNRIDNVMAHVVVRGKEIVVREADETETPIKDYEPGAWALWVRTEKP